MNSGPRAPTLLEHQNDQVYYAYEDSNPAVGQWDASSAVMGSVPAPCVRLWLAEEKLVQEAMKQNHETSPNMVTLDGKKGRHEPRSENPRIRLP